MAKVEFKTADEYIASFPAEKQAVLQQVRAAIRKGVPGAEEVISYSIPAFKHQGWVSIVLSPVSKKTYTTWRLPSFITNTPPRARTWMNRASGVTG
jgi:uncharacterized protein YdhG (YjbR/CyaY superfamily)